MESVREVRDITGGTVAFGTFGSAHHYLLAGLLQDFRTQYPQVRVRAIGQNSAEVADAVRDGQLEAGLVALPIDDRGLDVQPAMREEVLYISADPERLKEPMTIERLAESPLILFDARFGADDPMRTPAARARTERGREARAADRGRVRRPPRSSSPRAASATRSRSQQMIRSRGLARKLGGVPFDPPLYDTFAFITRRNAHLSPATREFMRLAEKRVEALRLRFEAER